MTRITSFIFFFLVQLSTTFQAYSQVDKDTLDFEVLAWDEPKSLIELQLGFGVGLGFINDRPQLVDGTVLADIIVQPKVGYYVNNYLQLGLQLTTYTSVTGINATDNYLLNYNLIGPYIRFQPNRSFFFELGRGWGSGREESRSSSIITSDARFSSAGWQPRIAVVSNWNSYLRFSLLVSYNFTRNLYENSETTFDVSGFGIQPTIAFGF